MKFVWDWVTLAFSICCFFMLLFVGLVSYISFSERDFRPIDSPNSLELQAENGNFPVHAEDILYVTRSYTNKHDDFFISNLDMVFDSLEGDRQVTALVTEVAYKPGYHTNTYKIVMPPVTAASGKTISGELTQGQWRIIGTSLVIEVESGIFQALRFESPAFEVRQ